MSISDFFRRLFRRSAPEPEPKRPEERYILCIDGGGMYGKLKDCRKLKEKIISYNDALIKYVTEYLKGKIPEIYRKPQGRIIIR